jgi:hypothetical protein
LAIPGWRSFVSGIALLALVQEFTLAPLFRFAILGSRKSSTFSRRLVRPFIRSIGHFRRCTKRVFRKIHARI